MEVVGLLKQITALIDRAVELLYEGAPLTPPEVDLLIPLRHATGPVIARRLADDMGRSRAGISKTLARLEKRGYITREPNPADRRAALVTVTPQGEQVIDAFFPQQVAVESGLLAHLGDGRPAVRDALLLLARTLGAPEPLTAPPTGAER